MRFTVLFVGIVAFNGIPEFAETSSNNVGNHLGRNIRIENVVQGTEKNRAEVFEPGKNTATNRNNLLSNMMFLRVQTRLNVIPFRTHTNY